LSQCWGEFVRNGKKNGEIREWGALGCLVLFIIQNSYNCGEIKNRIEGRV